MLGGGPRPDGHRRAIRQGRRTEGEPVDDEMRRRVFVEDADGNYVPVDAETGELVDSAV